MKPIAVIDFETDPFEYGKMVYPFAACFYDGTFKRVFWGDDCVPRLVEHIKNLENEYVIYAHNGGNFDFYYMLDWIEEDLLLINGRIVKCHIGKQELRDSYAIFPDPLSTYKKDEFDYDKMKRNMRERHKKEITEYLINDCKYLYEIVTSFAQEFGDHLTVGSCAIKHLKKFHKFQSGGEEYDARFRPFYFGGRNQCFKTGVIFGEYHLFDVNNMYGKAMRDFRHPLKCLCERSNRIGPRTAFAVIDARNYGALPVRKKTGGLDFTCERGQSEINAETGQFWYAGKPVFLATIHEINAGLDTGTLDIQKVVQAIDFLEWGTFQEFIDFYMDKRTSAKKAGDTLGVFHYKRIINSSYGKFSQDPEKYEDSCITHDDTIKPKPWRLSHETRGYRIWSKPSEHKNWFNVAIGASITGAARSILLRAIVNADTPIYCDTDSLICKALGPNTEIDPLKIGAWKHEGKATSVAIAGKKLYCIRGHFDKGATEKKAHKGSKLTGDQIFALASGEASEIEYTQPAPKFRLTKMPEKNRVENTLGFSAVSTRRLIKRTA